MILQGRFEGNIGRLDQQVHDGVLGDGQGTARMQVGDDVHAFLDAEQPAFSCELADALPEIGTFLPEDFCKLLKGNHRAIAGKRGF